MRYQTARSSLSGGSGSGSGSGWLSLCRYDERFLLACEPAKRSADARLVHPLAWHAQYVRLGIVAALVPAQPSEESMQGDRITPAAQQAHKLGFLKLSGIAAVTIVLQVQQRPVLRNGVPCAAQYLNLEAFDVCLEQVQATAAIARLSLPPARFAAWVGLCAGGGPAAEEGGSHERGRGAAGSGGGGAPS